MDVSLLLVLCLIRWRSERWADQSSRGVLPIVVCPSVIVKSLQQMFNELKRCKQQLSITMFFHKVEKNSVHYRGPSAINIICSWRHLAIIVFVCSVFSTFRRWWSWWPFTRFVRRSIANHSVTMPTPSPYFISSLSLCYHHITVIFIITIISDHRSKKNGEVGEYPQWAKIFFNKYNFLITHYVQVRSVIFIVKCVTICFFLSAYAPLWWRNMIFIKLTFSWRAVPLSYPCIYNFQIQTQILCAHCSFITVQFLSTLQEAPRVLSEVISVACTTHSWEIFCSFSGRILGGTVSTDTSVTLPFISLRILLFFRQHICWLDIPFDQVRSLSCSYPW